MSTRDHAIERARQRYGVELKMGDIRTMELLIETGNALLVRAHERAGSVYLVKHAQIVMIAVHGPSKDGPGSSIITFLPPHALTKSSRVAHSGRRLTKRRRAADFREVEA